MEKEYIKDKIFQGINFSDEGIKKGEYDNCKFDNCFFANSDLSDISFIECEFKNCDFSLAKVINTSFREVKFSGCKLLGLHFEDCNNFVLSATFDGCQLNLSTFYKLSLRNVTFKDCSLQEVDFSLSDMTSMIFEKCNLFGALFDNTILEKADFRTSYNYTIDPENNRIKKAKFSLHGVAGLLNKYNIKIE